MTHQYAVGLWMPHLNWGNPPLGVTLTFVDYILNKCNQIITIYKGAHHFCLSWV